jgi:hypothetical protein
MRWMARPSGANYSLRPAPRPAFRRLVYGRGDQQIVVIDRLVGLGYHLQDVVDASVLRRRGMGRAVRVAAMRLSAARSAHATVTQGAFAT